MVKRHVLAHFGAFECFLHLRVFAPSFALQALISLGGEGECTRQESNLNLRLRRPQALLEKRG